MNGGTQVCVPAPTSDGGGGGCSSSGDTTICSGSPSPPVPPPSTGVTDPATQVQGSDTTQQSGSTSGGGSPISVTTTVYGAPGTGTSSGTGASPGSGSSPPSSGQQPGDKGPASSSSTGSPDGSYSGGGNCASPPACTGDAALCGFARQSWALQCQLHSDLKGLTDTTGLADQDHTLGPDGDPDQIFSDGSSSGSGSGGDGDALSTLDASGFLGGGGSCPAGDPIMVDGHAIIDWSGLCQAMSLIAGFVLAMAYVYAAFIIAKGKAS